jgi:hypothetical protein
MTDHRPAEPRTITRRAYTVDVVEETIHVYRVWARDEAEAIGLTDEVEEVHTYNERVRAEAREGHD